MLYPTDRRGHHVLLPQHFGVLPARRAHEYGRALWHAAAQQREAEINFHIEPNAPHLLWQIDLDGWNISASSTSMVATPTSHPYQHAHPMRTDPGHDVPLRRLEDRRLGLDDAATLALLAGGTSLVATYCIRWRGVTRRKVEAALVGIAPAASQVGHRAGH